MIQEKSARVTCGGLHAGDLPVECGAEGTGKLGIKLSFPGHLHSLGISDVTAVLTRYDVIR